MLNESIYFVVRIMMAPVYLIGYFIGYAVSAFYAGFASGEDDGS